jgi:hypothetical protein
MWKKYGTDGRTDGRTDRGTISIEHIFLKTCSKKNQKNCIKSHLKRIELSIYTKKIICCPNGKFGFWSNRPKQIYVLSWPKNQLSQPILSVDSTTMSFLRQRTKSVVTTDLSVRATDKSVRRTTFGRFDHKPNFPFGQQIIIFGVIPAYLTVILSEHRPTDRRFFFNVL